MDKETEKVFLRYYFGERIDSNLIAFIKRNWKQYQKWANDRAKGAKVIT